MIPLSLPNLNGNEWKYVKECIDTGWISTAGKFVDEFESKFAKYIDSQGAVSVVNGTCALHIALQLLDVKHGDLVLVPNITFVASANAISYIGADPLLIDIDKKTWQMDLDLLEEFLKNKCCHDKSKNLIHTSTKRKISAIMIVHIQGNVCEMDRLKSLCNKYNLPILEDEAEALGSKYNGVFAGTIGDIGCFSFNGNKIMSTGGGGMIVSNNNNYLKRAKHLTTTAKSDPLRYFHDEVGYNYRLVNILAAMGLAQLEQLDGFVEAKLQIANFYRNMLSGIGDIDFQYVPINVRSNEWLFTITTNRMEELLEYLNKNNVMSRPFWVPMNQLPMYKDKIYITKSDVSRSVHKKALSIPCSTGIQMSQLETVVKTIKDFYKGG